MPAYATFFASLPFYVILWRNYHFSVSFAKTACHHERKHRFIFYILHIGVRKKKRRGSVEQPPLPPSFSSPLALCRSGSSGAHSPPSSIKFDAATHSDSPRSVLCRLLSFFLLHFFSAVVPRLQLIWNFLIWRLIPAYWGANILPFKSISLTTQNCKVDTRHRAEIVPPTVLQTIFLVPRGYHHRWSSVHNTVPD